LNSFVELLSFDSLIYTASKNTIDFTWANIDTKYSRKMKKVVFILKQQFVRTLENF